MTSVQKLGNICLQIVIDLGIEVSNENLPVQLVKKINEMKAINGQYITQDHMDKISYIGINYDGDTIDLNFKIYGNVHKVSCKKQVEVPLNQALMFLTQLDQDAEMKVDILFDGNATTVELSSHDCKWKWNLCLEVRYRFITVINFLYISIHFTCFISREMHSHRILKLKRKIWRQLYMGKNQWWTGNSKECHSVYKTV